MSYDLFSETCESEDDKPICWVNEVRNKVIDKYSKKYGLTVSGIIDGMPERIIHEVGVYLDINHVISKEKARQIVVECAQDFINKLNKHPQLKPYYKTYPLTAKNIYVALFISCPDRSTPYYPNLCVVSAVRGLVSFRTKDSDNKYKYKTEEEETFEEAVALVAKER